MSMAWRCALRSLSVRSGYRGCQADSGSGWAEGEETEEGKIKADSTPWVRSGGQALVCTLFGTALPLGRHGAAGCRKPSLRRVFGGTFAQNRRFRAGCRR